MKISGRKMLVAAVGLMVLGLGLVALVNLTSACHLRAVTVDHAVVDTWPETLGLKPQQPIVRQPVDSLARALLKRRGIFKVDIAYHLPDRLEISTNRFETVAMVVGMETGKLFGVNRDGRLVHIEHEDFTYEQPVLTGVRTGSLFSVSADARLETVAMELDELRRNRLHVYRLLEELDFTQDTYLVATLSGMPCRLWLRPACLVHDLDRFVEFIEGFAVDLSGVRRIDLRYDDVIICGTGEV